MVFLQQVRLLLYSLRRNGGDLCNVPVTMITVGEGLEADERRDFEERFGPIDFVVAPRLGGTPHTNKINAFFSVEPSLYDVLVYLDCDTVIRGPLDGILEPLEQGVEFLCRRGGELDRDRFVDFGRLVSRYAAGSGVRVCHDGVEEPPIFNTGVFVATAEAVRRIRARVLDIAYDLSGRWQRVDQVERVLLPMKLSTVFLYRHEWLRPLFRARLLSRQDVIEPWAIEQGAVALACMATGTRVGYLDERFNSWVVTTTSGSCTASSRRTGSTARPCWIRPFRGGSRSTVKTRFLGDGSWLRS